MYGRPGANILVTHRLHEFAVLLVVRVESVIAHALLLLLRRRICVSPITISDTRLLALCARIRLKFPTTCTPWIMHLLIVLILRLGLLIYRLISRDILWL